MGTLPPSAFANADAALAKSLGTGAPSPADLERQRLARVYLDSWAKAPNESRAGFRITTPRAALLGITP